MSRAKGGKKWTYYELTESGREILELRVVKVTVVL